MIPTAEDVMTQELAAVRGELARVDAKCSTLAALTGAAAAYAGGQAAHGPGAARLAGAAAAVVFTAAVLVLLLAVLRPRLAGGVGFCRWAALTPLEIREAAEAAATFNARYQADREAPGVLRVLSGLVLGKYRRLRLAVDLAAAGVVLLAAGALAGVIA